MNANDLKNEAIQIQMMLDSPGWRVMASEAEERKAKLTEQLIWSDDNEQKALLQANIRSMIFFLRFPAEVLEAARKMNEEAAQDSDPSFQGNAPA